MLMARKKDDKKEAPKEHKKPWQETYATMEEIERFIDDRVALRYNVVTHRTEYHLWSDEKGVTQGFQSMRTKHSRGYIVIQRSGDEIKARLQMLAGQFPIGQVTGDG